MWRDRDIIFGLLVGGIVGYSLTKDSNGAIVGAIFGGLIAGMIRI